MLSCRTSWINNGLDATVAEGLSSYLDDGDNVAYTEYQRASWKDKLIVGLFEDMTIIRRATK
jgi:hypothetical protein